jgi:hypothetical protein
MCNGHSLTNGHKCPFGCNSCVTAVAAGQSQRFYSLNGLLIINSAAPPTHQAGSDNRILPATPREDTKPTALTIKPTVKGPSAIYVCRCSWTGVPRAEAGGPGVDVYSPRHSARPFHHTRSSIARLHPPHPPITLAPSPRPPFPRPSFSPPLLRPSLLPLHVTLPRASLGDFPSVDFATSLC